MVGHRFARALAFLVALASAIYFSDFSVSFSCTPSPAMLWHPESEAAWPDIPRVVVVSACLTLLIRHHGLWTHNTHSGMRSQFIPQNVQEKNWACSSKPVKYLALNRAWKQRIPARGNNCAFPIISLAFPFANLDLIHIIHIILSVSCYQSIANRF